MVVNEIKQRNSYKKQDPKLNHH